MSRNYPPPPLPQFLAKKLWPTDADTVSHFEDIRIIWKTFNKSNTNIVWHFYVFLVVEQVKMDKLTAPAQVNIFLETKLVKIFDVTVKHKNKVELDMENGKIGGVYVH